MLAPVNGTRIEYDIRTYKSRRSHRFEDIDTATKAKVAAGSAVGTVLPMLLLAKKQNSKIYNIKYGLKEMILVSAGSIAGGLASGTIFDKKEHRKQKVHESVFQFMNASVPPLLTAGLYSFSKNIKYRIASTVVGLFGGMHIAAKLSNKINDPHDKEPDRKLTFKDSIANIDDALGVLILAKVPIAEKLHVDKTLPMIYSWCGYRAGISN